MEARARTQQKLAKSLRPDHPVESMGPDQQRAAIPQALGSALEHFRAGRLAETERICRQVLELDPNEADAFYLLGLIAQRGGKSDAAIELIGRAARLQPSNPFFVNSLGEIHSAANRVSEAEQCFRRALALEPGFAEVHNNLGNALRVLARWEEAERSYRQALAIDPSYANAHANLGTTLLELKRFTEAEATFRALLALRPDSADAHNGLGVALNELGRSGEAERCYRAALALEPEFAEAHNNLGNVLKDLGRAEGATQSYRRALAIKPDYTDAQVNLALALLELYQLQEAEQLLRAALALRPDSAAVHNGMGLLLQRQRRYEEAVGSYRRALALDPGFVDAHVNLGNSLKALDRFEEAEGSLRHALELDPGNASALNNLGLLLLDLGNIADAERHIRRSLEIKPGDADVSFNYATLLLLRGDYESGLRYYEFRLEGAGRRTFSSGVTTRQSQLKGLPRWQGEDLRGKRLLVWTEQGLGDSLMVMRYLPQLKDRGAARLVVCCEPALIRVMQTFTAVDRVVSSAEPLQLSGFDCHCPTMSLPLLFGTRLESIPSQVPYLRVPPELRRRWADTLAGISSPKIGLVWAGGKLLQADARRSVPLLKFCLLLDIPGPVFVSLQRGEEAKQLKESGRTLLDWMDECEDFLDTAALIEQLDLVISVDTAAAHLAGALGKPVWLLNRFESEWRWMLKREDSPWYPSMKIFRQSRPGDWDEVIARVATALRQRFGL
jgi:tetratricopeptide (TPR) repeat protein